MDTSDNNNNKIIPIPFNGTVENAEIYFRNVDRLNKVLAFFFLKFTFNIFA